MSSPDDTLRRLDRLIASRSILQHPFYLAWQRGELTPAQLATYATVYYPHVAAFPGYLTTAMAGAREPDVRAELAQNLSDELTEPRLHTALWLDFAAGLGLDPAAVAAAPPHPAAARVVTTFERLAGSGTAAALAALYAYEAQQPEVSRQKADGLRRHYGLADPGALAYFEVHAEADLAHRAGERRSLRRCLEEGADAESLIAAAEEALAAYWALLDGVCEEASLPAG